MASIGSMVKAAWVGDTHALWLRIGSSGTHTEHMHAAKFVHLGISKCSCVCG